MVTSNVPPVATEQQGKDARAGAASGRLLLDEPAPAVRLISVDGALGPDSSARLLRLLDSQLLLKDSGRRPLDTVLIDVSSLRTLERAGAAALAHARYACQRRDIDFALAGCSGGLFSASLAARSRLRGLRMFPTVDAALDALVRKIGGPETAQN